jgi:hypothetical protein
MHNQTTEFDCSPVIRPVYPFYQRNFTLVYNFIEATLENTRTSSLDM